MIDISCAHDIIRLDTAVCEARNSPGNLEQSRHTATLQEGPHLNNEGGKKCDRCTAVFIV